MLWMAGFHLCFDLNYYGLIQQNFYAHPSGSWSARVQNTTGGALSARECGYLKKVPRGGFARKLSLRI
jgi:hypothetical protein